MWQNLHILASYATNLDIDRNILIYCLVSGVIIAFLLFRLVCIWRRDPPIDSGG